MKKFLFSILAILFSANGISAQQMKLDRAVTRTAVALEGALPQKAKVAILNFTSPAATFSDYMIEELTGELVSGNKLTIVDRKNLALVSQEMKLQLSGNVSDESAQAIGKMLGAQSIVSGSLTNMGTFYRFRIKAINVETAAIQIQISFDIQNDDQISFLLSGNNAPGQSNTTQPPSQTNTKPAAQAVYKIGDKGPAGGLVFYDKGVVTNGWRYMEAAPNDLGPVQWGTYGTDGLSTAVGTGKTNTQRIVPVLEQHGEDGAALLCSALNINGYTDWFLPSSDELDLMYQNLKKKGLGNFANGRYWSSSFGYWNTRATSQNFGDGKQDIYEGKDAARSVRAVRIF